jgi:hypothetical protein
MQFNIDIDPEHLRGLMAAWRAATDIRIPMHERLKVHFMARRGEMLSNFSITASAWTMLLHGCTARGSDQDGLESLKKSVVEFKAWADEGLQALQQMSLQESIADDERHMPDDPQITAALRKMLGIPKPPERGAR